MNKAMEAAMNQQIKEELQSAYIYLAMSAYCEANNYPGFAHWLKLQAQEETAHAMKFYSFIHDRGGRVVLQAIEQPQVEWKSLTDLFENVLRHEQKVTSLIHTLYELAVAEKDYASFPMLQWFISEQVEEEKSAQDVLNLLSAAGSSSHTLLFVDRELGKRA